MFILNYYLFLNLIILLLMVIPMKFNSFHPLKLLFILIILIILISLKMNLIYKSWMNFFVIMIMVGGLMVVFMYITSLNNNSMVKFNYNNILINIMKFFLMMIFMYILFKYNYVFNLNMPDLWKFNLNIYKTSNGLMMMKLFNNYKMPMLFIMLYLYFSLICVMNICYKMKSPLRQICS